LTYLKELQRNWQAFGEKDPLWAVLTNPAYFNQRWDAEAFFETGRAQIASVMEQCASIGYPRARHACLDFGCGVGRLTQALADYFEQCAGVDIAPAMIEHARAYNRHAARCQYYVNEAPDLQLFADQSFDFIYSSIVLQHMQPEYSRGYIQEFVRLLAPGGLVIFQIPAERTVLVEQYAMPAAAFRAQLHNETPITTLQPGEQIELQVRARNTSSHTWPGTLPAGVIYIVGLGNHWLSEAGAMLIESDGRTHITSDVPPQGEVRFQLPITAPSEAGRYLLELDMVQEGVAWFQQHGSPVVRLPIWVTPRPLAMLRQRMQRMQRAVAPPASAPERPVMEMCGIPRDEVVALLETSGAEVLAVQEDKTCGVEWTSYTYVATSKRPTALP
jgi:SAM-dependent methyltransferase